MITASRAVDAVAQSEGEELEIKPLYLEALTLVERLHRRLLDVIKDEFDRMGRSDVNSVQALLLFNIGDSELTAGELRTRGYYLGSNVSYNLKKLVEMGYLIQEKSERDRRATMIRLSDKGLDMVGKLAQSEVKQADLLARSNPAPDVEATRKHLRQIERIWTDYIQYGAQ
ncbi:MAG: MarR family transcriptional regulator [Alphaproteobacteria bacterium]|nr:MAG: MarR family transcriptional regulator [Alphaproteobacteria bacterium]